MRENSTLAVMRETNNLLERKFISSLPLNYSLKRKIAFTLAEVLITLAVIGIVAAMTIPALISNTQHAEYKAAWKKIFAETEQAFVQTLNDGYDWKTIMAPSDSLPEDQRPIRLTLRNYFKVQRECIFPNNSGNCWVASFKTLDGTHTYSVGSNPDGSAFSSPPFDDGGFILQNGMNMSFEDNGSTKKYIWVDVNGFRPPNTIGIDIFGLQVTQHGLVPLGASTSEPSLHNTCQTSGFSCSAEYLYN